MKILFSFAVLLSFAFTWVWNTPVVHAAFGAEDPYLWLEDINADRSMAWVRAKNQTSQTRLEGDARFATVRDEIYQILTAKDLIRRPTVMGSNVLEFYQDQSHTRGILRRSSLQAYLSGRPVWETWIDIDELGRKENESWVYDGLDCLAPRYQKCMLNLSRGGRDATVSREWSPTTRDFVVGQGGNAGFQLPEAKMNLAWFDSNHLIVGTDFGPGSMTASGYPRILKLWTRGTPLASAQLLMEGKHEDISLSPIVSIRPEGTRVLLNRGVTFFEDELFEWKQGQPLKKVEAPRTLQSYGVFKGRLISKCRETVTVGGFACQSGDLIAYDLKRAQAHLVYRAGERESVDTVVLLRTHLLVSTLKDVTSKLKKLTLRGGDAALGRWVSHEIPMPDFMSVDVLEGGPFSDRTFISIQNFLTPTTLAMLEGDRRTVIQTLPARFNATGMTVDQRWSTSKDGTRIPYFIVYKQRPSTQTGPRPTLLYGYGGFEVSYTPMYSGALGKEWLEKGGVYVLSNIRGGGEFGPAWHQAAMKEHRQKAYDDFISVAEHLISTGVTDSRHLAIQGGSNGGLLVGAVMVQRPELYKSVVCQVPLLDMLRYHLLLAGASWVDEYGSPDDPRYRAVIEQYTPYQNLREGVNYPEMFLMTSTADDRVHPGHARKMAAKLEALGAPHLYFENTEGGHASAADPVQRARMNALMYVFLYQTLMTN